MEINSSSHPKLAASALQEAIDPADSANIYELADVDWDNLGLGLTPADHMYVMKCSKDEGFINDGKLIRYGNIEMSPGAAVLNYGQGLFEGMKALRREDGRMFLFRPEENAKRMKMGAERMCMPCPSVDLFIDAIKQTALANKRWIPPPGKGSLYIRPLLLGTGPTLGPAAAPEYTFLIYASPVCSYLKGGMIPFNLYVEDEYHRASPGGAGGVKAITNYAPVFKPVTIAKSRGFSDVLYLDSVEKKNLEEVSCCNIFLVKGNMISTPAAIGTILPGITRKSIIDIAYDLGYKVEERSIALEELMEADEVFCTGTAVVVASVGSITYKDQRVDYGNDSVCKELMSTFLGIQSGRIEDRKGWMVEIS